MPKILETVANDWEAVHQHMLDIADELHIEDERIPCSRKLRDIMADEMELAHPLAR